LTIDADLKKEWRAAVYRVEAGGGRVTFRIGEKPDCPELLPACETLTVVTAVNPCSENAPAAQNARAEKALLAYVREKGWRFHNAEGASANGDHVEPSLAVYDLAEVEARALGAHFGQGAVMFWAGGTASLVWMHERDGA
jgi:hypothetical protein